MLFEWDEAKHRANVAKHGFGFDFAARIFEGAVTEWCDTRRDWGEVRIVALGQVEGAAYVVVYAVRGNARRIISARRAKRKERR